MAREMECCVDVDLASGAADDIDGRVRRELRMSHYRMERGSLRGGLLNPVAPTTVTVQYLAWVVDTVEAAGMKVLRFDLPRNADARWVAESQQAVDEVNGRLRGAS